MDRKKYILKNVYDVSFLAIRILTDNGEIVSLPYEEFEKKDPICCNPALRNVVYECGKKTAGKYAVYNDNGYFYCIFCKKDQNVIWGPFVLEVHSELQERMYLGRNQVKQKSIYIPLLNADYIKKRISFIHGLLFEEYGEKQELFENNWLEEKSEGFHASLSEYILQNAEQEREHFSFQREQEFFEYLLNGKIDIGEVFQKAPGELDDFRDLYGRQGIIAESQKKSMEYTAVIFIALLTRHVITAGLNETEAYRLSDVSLQELSGAENIMDIECICRNSNWQFISMVREHRESGKGESVYIVQSKDYIAKHIFEKISLKEIADEVGVHPAYLSRLFSEQTGVGILHYILQEKIRISCNLLKYSGKPIAVIAEYVNLSPQSYFSKVFKKMMDQTPAQYRKEHPNKNFWKS